MNENDFIIDSNELIKIIYDNNIKVIDSSWGLNTDLNYYENYKKSHIPNAIFFDVELFSNETSNLPHMFPNKKKFETLLSEVGIRNNDEIVIYDQNGFFSSTRTWFMFKYFGHTKVSILNGGFNDWIKKKFITNSDTVIIKKSKYKASTGKYSILKRKEVENLIKKNKFIVVDARPKDRFESLVAEPRQGIKKGKIEGSINIPFNLIHDSTGMIKEKKNLEKLFYNENKLTDRKVICSCGSGITACNIIFSLLYISHEDVYLYDGSWAEWGKI